MALKPLNARTAPKSHAPERIVQFVRGMSASQDSNIETLYKLNDGMVEALEFIVRAGSPVIGVPLAKVATWIMNGAKLKDFGLEKEVNVVRTGCFGLCALGPIMIVYPEGSFYSRVTPEDVPEIVSEHLLKGRVIQRLVYKEEGEDDGVKSFADTDFAKKQHRVALRNCGVINPENIDEYIGTRGYEALGKVLTAIILASSSDTSSSTEFIRP